MELYGPSIRGSWVDIEGKVLYKYSDACFLGLQVLGDNAIPCFQGSSFFSLEEQQIYSLLTTLLEKFDQLSIGGNTQMENNNTLTFALSDNQKQNAIFKALNPEVIRYFVMDSYEDYALVFDMETEKVMKVGYTKDESDNIIIAEEFVEMVAEYVTKEEKEVLDGLRSKTESASFEALGKVFEENEKTIADLKIEVDNKDVEISTLKTDKENLVKDNTDMADAISGFVAKTEQLESDIATLNTLNSELQSFKDKVEKAEKEAVIAKYSVKLDAATIESFTAKIDEYSIHDLKKDLAFALVEGNESLFAEKPAVPAYVPSEQNLTGLEALLSKYKK